MALTYLMFLCIALFAAAVWWHATTRQQGTAGLVVICESGPVTRLRPSYRFAIVSMLLAAGLTTFLAMFLLAFNAIPFGEPSNSQIIAALIFVGIIAAFTGLASTWKIFRGSQDILLDDATQSLRFKGHEIPY